jgi:hypothetical protein
MTWAFLALSLALGYQAAHDMGNRNTDLDLYYFGGLVERSGSYTDTPAVLALAKEAERGVAPEGVYGSPTLVGLIYQPLSFLPLETAQFVFAALAAVIFALAVRRAAGDSWWPVWLGLAALSTSNILAFSLGNFAIVTTALLLFAYGSLRDGRPRQAGIALGFAIAFKLYPVFLLVPLVMKRQWTTTATTVATAGGLLAITPLLLGWYDFVDAVRQTLDIASHVHPWSDNTGLPGSVLRATDSQTIAQWTSRVALTGSVAVIWWLRKKPVAPLFAFAALLMCLSQGISWNMYYGVALMAALALRPPPSIPAVWLTAAVSYVLACGFLLMSTYRLFGLPRGVPITIGLVMLTVTFGISLVRRTTSDPTTT